MVYLQQQELGIFLLLFRMNIHIAEFRRRTLFDRTEDAKKGGKTGETRLKCCLREDVYKRQIWQEHMKQEYTAIFLKSVDIPKRKLKKE